MKNLIKFIVITTLSIFILSFIINIDQDFNVRSYIYGVAMAIIIGDLYYI